MKKRRISGPCRAASRRRAAHAFPKRGEGALLLSGRIEILRREPSLETALQTGPFAVEHGKPSGVAVAALGHHVLAEGALEAEAEAQGRAAGAPIRTVAFPFQAAIAEGERAVS